ncbi:MAG: TrkH family potassium uptake protein [Paracoccaceae bacterium]
MEELRAALHVTSIAGFGIAVAMLVPAFVNLAADESSWIDFAWASTITGFCWALIATATRGVHVQITPRFGIILVNMLWWVVPMTSVAPLMVGPTQLGYIDAAFETVSGFTTTGSTVLIGLDGYDPGTLIWRSLIQWFGGTGMLSLGLIVLPFLKVGGLQLFRLESSDRSEKVLPRFATIVRSIIVVYVLLTVLCGLGYVLSGMSVFDAVNHAMTTLSTGGFSTHDQSMGFFENNSTLWVGSVFMILGGLPFTLFVTVLYLRQKPRRDPQIRWFLAIIAGAVFMLLVSRAGSGVGSSRSVAEDFFDVISVITTTGFAAGDYTTWGNLALPLFFILTFFGGCAGSTAGGLKIYRLIVLTQMVRVALREIVHPHGVFRVRYGRKQVDPAIFRSALVMSVSFAGIVAVCTLILGSQGNDLITSLSGAVTALANVGPGLGSVIGPAGTFTNVPDASKITLAAAMIAGRLEIMVVLALLLPAMWR